MDWKPASRGYAILNAPQTPFLVWGRVRAARTSTLYIDMWTLIHLLAIERKFQPDQTSLMPEKMVAEIKRLFETREEVSGFVKLHPDNSHKWFFPVQHVNLFLGFLPDDIRPNAITRGRFKREFEKICKMELKYEGVTEYGKDESAEVAKSGNDALSCFKTPPEKVVMILPDEPSPPPVVIRVSKRLREKASAASASSEKSASAREKSAVAREKGKDDMYPDQEQQQQQDKDDDDPDPREEFSGYSLRPKRTRPERPDIVESMTAKYGGTVYANSQEELEADAGRLVNLGYQSEEGGPGKGDEDIFQDERIPVATVVDPTAPIVEIGLEEEEEQPMEIDEDSAYHPSRSPSVERDYDFGVGDSKPGTKMVNLSLDSAEQRIRLHAAAIESFLLVANYAHDHHGHHRRAQDNPFAQTLDDIEGQLVQSTRRIMELLPPSADKTTISIPAIEDADGTEVRMHDMARSLSLDWSKLSSDEQRDLARQVRDEHKRVYGVYPRKKRMMYGGGRAGMIYFYNQETADACMKPVLERYIAQHVAATALRPPGYFSENSKK